MVSVEEVISREPTSNRGGGKCGPIWGKKTMPKWPQALWDAGARSPTTSLNTTVQSLLFVCHVVEIQLRSLEEWQDKSCGNHMNSWRGKRQETGGQWGDNFRSQGESWLGGRNDGEGGCQRSGKRVPWALAPVPMQEAFRRSWGWLGREVYSVGKRDFSFG